MFLAGALPKRKIVSRDVSTNAYSETTDESEAAAYVQSVATPTQTPTQIQTPVATPVQTTSATIPSNLPTG